VNGAAAAERRHGSGRMPKYAAEYLADVVSLGLKATCALRQY
jgi:hypothetical protein